MSAASTDGGAPSPEDRPLPVDLRRRVDALLAGGTRRLLGLTGPPGAGKSTLAARVVAELRREAAAQAGADPGADVVAVVPMDGFHLAQATLERLGRADRKGAPDTFDADGFVALLRRLRDPAPGRTVWVPEYRRDLRHGITGALAVPAAVPLVVVEGNYLLLPDDGFGPVADLLDEVWYVAPDDALRLARLEARHVRTGKTPEAARAWTLGPDEANARRIAATAGRADVQVREDAVRDWRA